MSLWSFVSADSHPSGIPLIFSANEINVHTRHLIGRQKSRDIPWHRSAFTCPCVPSLCHQSLMNLSPNRHDQTRSEHGVYGLWWLCWGGGCKSTNWTKFGIFWRWTGQHCFYQKEGIHNCTKTTSWSQRPASPRCADCFQGEQNKQLRPKSIFSWQFLTQIDRGVIPDSIPIFTPPIKNNINENILRFYPAQLSRKSAVYRSTSYTPPSGV